MEAGAITQEAEILGLVEGKPLLYFGTEGFEDVGGISCKVWNYLIIYPAPIAVLQDLHGMQKSSLDWTGHHGEETQRTLCHSSRQLHLLHPAAVERVPGYRMENGDEHKVEGQCKDVQRRPERATLTEVSTLFVLPSLEQ